MTKTFTSVVTVTVDDDSHLKSVGAMSDEIYSWLEDLVFSVDNIEVSEEGLEGPWRSIGSIDIGSGHCWIGDPIYVAPANCGLEVESGPGDGKYPVEARYVDGAVTEVRVRFDQEKEEQS